ncbi:MAG TPA: hypothetical protein PK970_06945 [Hyphomicrobiaceae bacterium]|nr:hypothetical protein [Hyphomicrobiaceae bacterium]
MNDKQLRVLLFSGILAIAAGVLAVLTLFHRPLPPDGDPVLGSAQVVVFELDDCALCQPFRKKLAPLYYDSEFGEAAPIRYVNIDGTEPPKRYRLKSPVEWPTVVFFDPYGRELARLDKFPEKIDPVISMVRRHIRYAAKTS